MGAAAAARRMMLKQSHVDRHNVFLHQLLETPSIKQLRKKISSASHHQLSVLIRTVAAIALKQIPANEAVASAFYKSRKKRVLKRHFGSWRKVRALLSVAPTNHSRVEEWRRLLLELAPLIRPTLSVLFAS